MQKFYLGLLWGTWGREDFPRPASTWEPSIHSCGFVRATLSPAATVLGLLERSLRLPFRKTGITDSRKLSLLSRLAKKYPSTGNSQGFAQALVTEFAPGAVPLLVCELPREDVGSLTLQVTWHLVDTRSVFPLKLGQSATERRLLWKRAGKGVRSEAKRLAQKWRPGGSEVSCGRRATWKERRHGGKFYKHVSKVCTQLQTVPIFPQSLPNLLH